MLTFHSSNDSYYYTQPSFRIFTEETIILHVLLKKCKKQNAPEQNFIISKIAGYFLYIKKKRTLCRQRSVQNFLTYNHNHFKYLFRTLLMSYILSYYKKVQLKVYLDCNCELFCYVAPCINIHYYIIRNHIIILAVGDMFTHFLKV